MIDRTPKIYEINFSIFNSHTKFIDVPLKTYRQTNKLFQIGTEEIISSRGHKGRTYNLKQTLCDIEKEIVQTLKRLNKQ